MQKVCSVCGLEPPCPEGSREQVRGWEPGGGGGRAQGLPSSGLQPDSSWPRAALRPAGATSQSSGRLLRCIPWHCAVFGPGPATGVSPKAWAGAATATVSPPPGSPAAALVTMAVSAEVSVLRLASPAPKVAKGIVLAVVPQKGCQGGQGLGAGSGSYQVRML